MLFCFDSNLIYKVVWTANNRLPDTSAHSDHEGISDAEALPDGNSFPIKILKSCSLSPADSIHVSIQLQLTHLYLEFSYAQ